MAAAAGVAPARTPAGRRPIDVAAATAWPNQMPTPTSSTTLSRIPPLEAAPWIVCPICGFHTWPQAEVGRPRRMARAMPDRPIASSCRFAQSWPIKEAGGPSPPASAKWKISQACQRWSSAFSWRSLHGC